MIKIIKPGLYSTIQDKGRNMSNDLQFKISHKIADENSSNFLIKPLERGYGITVGNSLRRALLTAVPGAAITNVKIEGALHEFSTLDGIKEDIADVIMNLKGVRFHLFEAKAQQEALGLMGLNLIYGAYYKYDQPRKLLKYLYDHIDPEAIEIDTINFSGPLFKKVDNRLMSLELVKNDMTKAVMFGPDGNNVLPAKVLYKKNILAIRGSFRPVTLVNEDMFIKSNQIISREKSYSENKLINLFEITLSNLKSNNGDVNEEDFMDRAKLLCALGHTVMITNFKEYYKLAEYFSSYTEKEVVLTMGVNNLIEIFDEKYYDNLRGGILEAFGKLFVKNLRVFLYPTKAKDGTIVNSNNIHVANKMKNLYKFFKYNNRLLDIFDYDESLLDIYSIKVLEKIKKGEKGWEKMLPQEVTKLIKSKNLFGFK